jgi:hypothetical protein
MARRTRRCGKAAVDREAGFRKRSRPLLTGRLAQMQGIEVLVQIHSWAAPNGYPDGGVLERAPLLAKRKPGDPHPFVDPSAWTQFVKRAQASAARTVEQEKQKAAAAR